MEGKTPQDFTAAAKKQPRLAVGYECTPISDAEEICGEPRDVLDATRHYEQFEADFDLQKSLGVRELRYPACRDKILAAPFESLTSKKPRDYLKTRGFYLFLFRKDTRKAVN